MRLKTSPGAEHWEEPLGDTSMAISKNMTRAGLAALLATAAMGAMLAGGATAQGPAAQAVDDFVLPDQHYLARQLYRMSDAKAVVLITYASGDATVRKEAGAYEALKAAYKAKGVEVMMLASKLGEAREKVGPEAKAMGLTMPILFDYDQLIGEGLNDALNPRLADL